MQLNPATMPPVGTVDLRFQSYNVEMVEVTGGRFWAPYAAIAADGERYRERPPTDLEDPKLRRLAAALGPAYMRVSGTWANSTYFCDSDPGPAAPPTGFGGVLTHQRWQSVVDFARAVDAEIVTSVAISAGTRDAAARWLPDQARRFFAFTNAIGGTIAGTEFMNEPSARAGSPEGYDAAAFGRDFQSLRDLVAEVSPQTLLLGPGAIGDRLDAAAEAEPLSSQRLLAETAPAVDVFSYHHYGAASRRCAGDTWWPQTRPQDALTEDWLGTTERAFAVYRALRDRFTPGKPIWLTETADTVCGGNPWAVTFLDSFRYLDQLGRLAKSGVQAVMHNTFAASDYGMIDETTLQPRPNYWCALLWRKLMGTTVLDAGLPATADLHLYAHTLRDRPGGVALLALNTDRKAERVLTLPLAAERYTLSAEPLQGGPLALNGIPLALDAGGNVPSLTGVATPPGALILPPASITFLAVPSAGNTAA